MLPTLLVKLLVKKKYFGVSGFRVDTFVCGPTTYAPSLPSAVNILPSCLLRVQDPHGTLKPSIFFAGAELITLVSAVVNFILFLHSTC